MFSNIGSKIKGLAVTLCVLGIIGSVITGIVFFSLEEPGLGCLFLIGGTLVSWIGSFFTYGFGELIEKTDQIERNIRHGKTAPSFSAPAFTAPASSSSASAPASAKASSPVDISELDSLLAEGLITKEDYQKVLEKRSNCGE